MEYNWIADLIINLPEGTDQEAFFTGLEDRINAYIERRGGRAVGTFALIKGEEDGKEGEIESG